MRTPLACIIVGLVLAGAGASAPRPDAGDAVAWYVVRFSGTAVGVAKDLMRELPDGRYYESALDIEATRLGTPMRMVVQTTEWNDLAGRVVRFTSEVMTGGSTMSVSGVLSGDTIRFTSTSGNHIQPGEVVWQEGAVGNGAADRRIQDHLRGGDSEFTLHVFDPQAVAFVSSRYVVGESFNDDAFPGRRLVAVDRFDDGADVPAVRYWIDGDALDPVRMSIRQMGLDITMDRVSADELRRIDIDRDFDIIAGSRIPVAGFPDVRPLVTVTYRLEFVRLPDDLRELEGPNQSVVARNGDTIDVQVSRTPLNTLGLEDRDRARYLAPDRYIQSDHPAVRTIVDSVRAASGATGMALAEELARWVSDFITRKSFGSAFAPTSEILVDRQGDCTEHSILLASVLRAAGIPARIVIGLAYGDGYLVGHMWTEYYAGRWRTLDALDLDTRPIRIRLTASRDERALAETEVVQAYTLVGGLHAEVTEYTTEQ